VEAGGAETPVRLVHGDPRRWTATDSLLAALPNADRVVIDGAGHSPWSEQAAATRRAVLAHIQDDRPR
jgi:proline iminopeptidase